jgi:hypothetical protein
VVWKEERGGEVETVASYELRVVPEVRDHAGADPEDYGVEQQIAAMACLQRI